MVFDFDPDKNRKNAAKHGIDFDQAQKLWHRPYVIIPTKHVRGENRYAILGKIRSKLHMAIFTMRDDIIRIISCHRVDKKWERLYARWIKEKKE